MKSFFDFLVEEKLNKNQYGKLHEVLVGGLVNHYAKVYQQNIKKGHDAAHEMAMQAISNPKRMSNSHMYSFTHMPQFRDTDNKTAEELHNEIGNIAGKENYEETYKHALHGASHLINHLHLNDIKDIKGVHFTANKNDIKKLTGVEDDTNNSDVVVEHGNKNIGNGYFGVSLKAGSESKLFNSGLGKFSKQIDNDYQKITGKQGSFEKDSEEAENAAKLAHGQILKKHGAFLEKHFGKNGISSPGKLSYGKDGNPILLKDSDKTKDAFRYLEKAEDDKNKSMYKSDEDRKKFADIYKELRDSRTEIAKRATNASFGRHMSEIMNHQTPENKETIRSFLKRTVNVGRDLSKMPVMRLNTWKNSPAEIKKGADERTSQLSDAESDFDSHFNSSYGNYKISSNPGAISTTLSGPSGHGVSYVVDSSPAGGATAVNRRGVHMWDKSKSTPPMSEPVNNKKTPAAPSKPAPAQSAAAEPKQVNNEMFGRQVHADHEMTQGHA